tara:strand:- start:19 stop:1197 length:1179 start_codon:yes stop_codon:yes gene_type:complete
MSYYKFNKNEIFYNTIKAHPKVKFDVSDNNVYYNNLNIHSGAFVDNITHTEVGSLSLYELNIDRPSDSLIYPFITKDGSFEALQGISEVDYNTAFQTGDVISGSYPLSASLSRERFASNHGITSPTGSHILALKNTLNYYKPISNHYAFSSSLGNKEIQELTLLYIPSIFYGSEIKKGTVDLKFYISGTLVGRLQDLYYNGELIQTDGTEYAQTNGNGSVAGVILYTEGIAVLTGSWNLTEDPYDFGDVTRQGDWINFAAGANDDNTDVTPSASFEIGFEGTNHVETLTMFAQVNKNDLNYSTNRTYINYESYQSGSTATGSTQYTENNKVDLYNTVSSSFYDYEEKFKHQTFISKIGIYDEKKNLIAIANVATPIKKTGERDFTFKLKLDL